MTIFYLILAILSGGCMAFQSPTNATLSRYTGNMQATCISFGGGAICLAILVLFAGDGNLSQIVEASWWNFFGGIYGVSIVLIITYAIPKLGAALTSTILMLGQLTGGMLVDSLGLLRTSKIKANSWRWAGMVIIAVGVVIVTLSKL